MLFIFDRPGRYAFWMKGMKFPLDFVWILGGEVIEIRANVGVEELDVRPSQPVDMILEVNSGFAARNNLKIGDKVSYEPVSN